MYSSFEFERECKVLSNPSLHLFEFTSDLSIASFLRMNCKTCQLDIMNRIFIKLQCISYALSEYLIVPRHFTVTLFIGQTNETNMFLKLVSFV